MAWTYKIIEAFSKFTGAMVPLPSHSFVLVNPSLTLLELHPLCRFVTPQTKKKNTHKEIHRSSNEFCQRIIKKLKYKWYKVRYEEYNVGM